MFIEGEAVMGVKLADLGIGSPSGAWGEQVRTPSETSPREESYAQLTLNSIWVKRRTGWVLAEEEKIASPPKVMGGLGQAGRL